MGASSFVAPAPPCDDKSLHDLQLQLLQHTAELLLREQLEPKQGKQFKPNFLWHAHAHVHVHVIPAPGLHVQLSRVVKPHALLFVPTMAAPVPSKLYAAAREALRANQLVLAAAKLEEGENQAPNAAAACQPPQLTHRAWHTPLLSQPVYTM